MFKCEVCAKQSKPKESLRRHTVYRESVRQMYDGKQQVEQTIRQIEREINVCSYCGECLSRGEPLEGLIHRTKLQQQREQAAALVKANPTAKPVEPIQAPPLPPPKSMKIKSRARVVKNLFGKPLLVRAGK